MSKAKRLIEKLDIGEKKLKDFVSDLEKNIRDVKEFIPPTEGKRKDAIRSLSKLAVDSVFVLAEESNKLRSDDLGDDSDRFLDNLEDSLKSMESQMKRVRSNLKKLK